VRGPRTAVVRLSDIIEHERMDAGFLTTLVLLREKTEEMRRRYGPEQAVALLDALPLSSKVAMGVLKRGSVPRPMTNSESHELAVEYPHLALALVSEDVQESIERVRAEISRSNTALDRLIELSGPSSPDGGRDHGGIAA